MKYFVLLSVLLLLAGCAGVENENEPAVVRVKHLPHAVFSDGHKLGPQADRVIAECFALGAFAALSDKGNTRLPFTRIQIWGDDWVFDYIPGPFEGYICPGDCDESGNANYPARIRQLEAEGENDGRTFRLLLTDDRVEEK